MYSAVFIGLILSDAEKLTIDNKEYNIIFSWNQKCFCLICGEILCLSKYFN